MVAVSTLRTMLILPPGIEPGTLSGQHIQKVCEGHVIPLDHGSGVILDEHKAFLIYKAASNSDPSSGRDPPLKQLKRHLFDEG